MTTSAQLLDALSCEIIAVNGWHNELIEQHSRRRSASRAPGSCVPCEPLQCSRAHDLSSCTSLVSDAASKSKCLIVRMVFAMYSSSPQTGLLVLNSMWFAFQSPTGIPHSSRAAALDKTKDALARACASSGLSVRLVVEWSKRCSIADTRCPHCRACVEQVVITTQLATKLVNADGSPANFDTGVRAVMVPQLGEPFSSVQTRSFNIASAATVWPRLQVHATSPRGRPPG